MLLSINLRFNRYASTGDPIVMHKFIMNQKKMLFPKDKPKISPIYLLSLTLSIWGVGNVFYWEIYKGYSACTICAWRRAVYIALFILLLMLFKYKKLFIKFLVWIVLILETLVSLIQVFEMCSPLVCRYISLVDKLNLTFAGVTLALTFIFELMAYLKYRRNLRLQVRHVEHFPHSKVDL